MVARLQIFNKKPTPLVCAGGGYVTAVATINALQNGTHTQFGFRGVSTEHDTASIKIVSGNSGGTWGMILYFQNKTMMYDDIFKKMTSVYP